MKISEIIRTIRKNPLYKTLFLSLVSIFVTLCYALYNLYLSVNFRDGFAIGISVYYFLLITVKAASLIVERSVFHKREEIKLKVRKRNYKISSVFIFVIDFCLIAPIILMALSTKAVPFGQIPSIVMATFSVYKISASIVNYKKSKKSKNLTVILFREINVIEAIVSVLTLQHTLIMVNGGMDESMQNLSLISSAAFIAVIIAFSILSYYKNLKSNKTL